MQDFFRDLLDQSKTDVGAFSQLLTEIDKLDVLALQYEQLLQPPKLAFRVGITGAMGVGKSVLISQLIEYAYQEQWKIGILAIDPTGPFSQGAILGDRIRLFSEHSSNVFFRSIGSRKGIGGICHQAYLMLRAFDWAGFDIVFVETVGVGQTEWEIMNVADITSLVLVPESGDGIQFIKSGLIQIADIFIINKFDRSGASLLQTELLKSFKQSDEKKTPAVFSAVAVKNKGIKAIFDYLLKVKQQGQFQKQRWSKERLQAEAKALLRWKFEKDFLQPISQITTCKDLQTILK